jgi:regulatory protein YycI of two-component signal transduction system YycFG
MDWSKAKNILIIAFIITNLLLIYVIKSNENSHQMYPTINEAFIEDVKDRLLRKNIQVSTEIPKETPSLPILNVEYEIYNSPHKLAKSFLGEYNQGHHEFIYYNDKGEKLTLIDDKRILYESNSKNKLYDNLSKEQLIKITEDFIEQNGFKTGDYRLNNFRFTNGKYFLEYTKLYNGMSIETSYMRFEIDKTGIKKFERQWVKSIVPNERKIIITPAPEALLKLLLMEEHYGKTIMEIELCYSSSFEERNPEDWKRIVKSNVDPTWKVKFKDGTKELGSMSIVGVGIP